MAEKNGKILLFFGISKNRKAEITEKHVNFLTQKLSCGGIYH
jgi:hypothetical protein